MRFEFAITPSFNFLNAFAEQFNVPVFKNSVVIPASMGQGVIKKIDIEPCFKLVIHNYTLAQELYFKRLPSTGSADFVSIIFNSSGVPSGCPHDKEKALQFLKKNGSAIQISSIILGTETFFPEKSEVCFAAVGIKRSLLASMLKIEKGNNLIHEILYGTDTFFFHERMSVDEKKIIKQLSRINELGELSNLYFRIKVEELLHILFSKLLARESLSLNAISNSDVEKLFKVRAKIITDLSIQPNFKELSQTTGIGEGKMKQLFKQIFGDTIYTYYQKERMQEAAFLIKQAGYTVSEAGYHLGFTNLSHFGRLFEKHFGVTPKKYSYVS